MARSFSVMVRRHVAAMGVVSTLGILATPIAASALAITVPSTVNLGSVASGTSTRSASLGTVTATDTGVLGILASFTAQVSSTNFTTGAATTAETIPKVSISYWSGPVTASSGSQTAVPGQLIATLAVSLSVPRTAFSSSGINLLSSISTSWNPTIVIAIPSAAVSGTYTGTITHSVA